MPLPCYEVYALRYATVARRPEENFIAADPHDGPTSKDYFVWAILGQGGDRGRHRVHRRGGRPPPARVPALSDRSVADVGRRCAGGAGRRHHAPALRPRRQPRQVPGGSLHLQETELAFATGPCMCEPFLRHAYDVNDVVQMVRNVYAGRVALHRGDVELRPGISLHRIGGHTDGLQAVRVHTRRGWVVLASDATHYAENFRRRSPFPIVYHVGDMLRGYDRLRMLADSDDHVVPGHDPAVLRRYPAARDDCQDIVALHVAGSAEQG